MDTEMQTQGQLYWACRRGMLELDLILIPFVREAYPELGEAEQALFQVLLTHNDPELYRWLTGKEMSQDIAIQQLIDKIIVHATHSDKSQVI